MILDASSALRGVDSKDVSDDQAEDDEDAHDEVVPWAMAFIRSKVMTWLSGPLLQRWENSAVTWRRSYCSMSRSR